MQQKVYLAPFYIIAATFIGIGDTLYLAYYHVLGLTPTCAVGGCEIVLNSPYSSPWGIVPLSYVGLVFYLYFLALAVLLAIDPTSRGLKFGLLAYATIGLLFSIFFEIFQYFVIHALCMYCAISAVTTLILFCLAIWHWRGTKVSHN